MTDELGADSVPNTGALPPAWTAVGQTFIDETSGDRWVSDGDRWTDLDRLDDQ